MELYDIGFLISLIALAAVILALEDMMFCAVKAWMKRKNRPLSDYIWFGRSLAIICFLLCLYIGGFNFCAKILGFFLLLNLVILNPWYLRGKKIT